jgi:hypothetical protein
MTTDNKIEPVEPLAPVERKRGGCLSAVVIVSMIVNMLAGLSYIFAGSRVLDAYPGMPGWVIPIYTVLCLFGAVSAYGVWSWKKWGLYGFAFVSLISFIFNVIYIGFLLSLSGFLGLVILYFLIRPVWKYME